MRPLEGAMKVSRCFPATSIGFISIICMHPSVRSETLAGLFCLDRSTHHKQPALVPCAVDDVEPLMNPQLQQASHDDSPADTLND